MNTVVEEGKRSFFAHPLALVDSDRVGDRTRIWAFAHVMAGARVGADCNIGEHVFIEASATVGNNVTVKNCVSIWAQVTVEDNVFLGPHCVLTNDPDPRAYIKKSVEAMLPTLIHANATVGANATVLCGITIGRTRSSAPARW
jgi:UDP-2-acetamido-3-amino-2,3-dideoxy-glucuronate N-acetyltransferase